MQMSQFENLGNGKEDETVKVSVAGRVMIKVRSFVAYRKSET